MSFLPLRYVKCCFVRTRELSIMQDRPSIGTKCWPYAHPFPSPSHVVPALPSVSNSSIVILNVRCEIAFMCSKQTRVRVQHCAMINNGSNEQQRNRVFHGDYRDHCKHHRTKWEKEYYDAVYIHPTGVLYYSVVRALPQVVSDRRLTAEAQFRSQANICGICTWRSVSLRKFSIQAVRFSLSASHLKGSILRSHLSVIIAV
jgi:hypothetical protein